MKMIIEVELPSPVSKQRERELMRIVEDLKEDLEPYGGKVTRAVLQP